jgi:hypothetical protein
LETNEVYGTSFLSVYHEINVGGFPVAEL